MKARHIHFLGLFIAVAAIAGVMQWDTTQPVNGDSQLDTLQKLLSLANNRGALVDHSGSITAGGTAQVVTSANVDRHYLMVQNNSAGDEWVNFGISAVVGQPSVRIVAGDTATWDSFIPTQSISIIGATTGQTFTIKDN